MGSSQRSSSQKGSKDSLKLLSRGERTAEPRHRSLRATLEWSHELLSEAERVLFGRLSVFAGGWTLEAAEMVCSGKGIEEGEVLDLLSELVDRSLVEAEAGQEGVPRFRMLEPIRQYGRERLEESREADTVLRRHAAWYLALAEEAEPALKGKQTGIVVGTVGEGVREPACGTLLGARTRGGRTWPTARGGLGTILAHAKQVSRGATVARGSRWRTGRRR